MPQGVTSSEAVTEAIRVTATPQYMPEHSSPADGKFLFAYNIKITNEGDTPVKLLSRKWTIINADGDENEVRGEGVIGETPMIEVGQCYEYNSFSILDTPFGTMEGHYIMQREDGDLIQVQISRFYLATNAEAAKI